MISIKTVSLKLQWYSKNCNLKEFLLVQEQNKRIKQEGHVGPLLPTLVLVYIFKEVAGRSNFTPSVDSGFEKNFSYAVWLIKVKVKFKCMNVWSLNDEIQKKREVHGEGQGQGWMCWNGVSLLNHCAAFKLFKLSLCGFREDFKFYLNKSI